MKIKKQMEWNDVGADGVHISSDAAVDGIGHVLVMFTARVQIPIQSTQAPPQLCPYPTPSSMAALKCDGVVDAWHYGTVESCHRLAEKIMLME
jgi:hypothetical protein